MILDLTATEIDAIKWALSTANAILYNDIKNGTVQYDMPDRDARELHRNLSQLNGMFHSLWQRANLREMEEKDKQEAFKRFIEDVTQSKTV